MRLLRRCRHARKALALLALGLLLWLCPPQSAQVAPPPSLTAAFNRLLDPAHAGTGQWGVYVYSLDHHRVLYDHQGEELFPPASNAKLFTTAAALQLIGPDYRFHTPVVASAAPDASGQLNGDLVLVGRGDPSLSGRAYPYHYDPHPPLPPFAGDASMQSLARQLRARGLALVTGDIVGDDSYFDQDPYPPGWALSDIVWGYGAPVSALSVADNSRFVLVRPGATSGDPATLELAPAVPGEPLPENAVVTAAAGATGDIEIERDGDQIRIRGRIPLGGPTLLATAAVEEPALAAARLLRQALLQQGIVVEGGARARHRPPPAATPRFELASLDSPPLFQILQTADKESLNLDAELLLHLLGKLQADAGTRAAGERVLADFLRRAGLGADDALLVDGSGLSRLDLASPAGIVRLLRYMDAQPSAAQWRALLPVAGRDGTLAHRLLDLPPGSLLAKTGTLAHVASLSGYGRRADGERVAFSFLAADQPSDSAATDSRLDALARALILGHGDSKSTP